VPLVVAVIVGCSESKPLFNGRNLDGWVEVGSEGSWSVDKEILGCNGQASGYAWLSTARKFGDFELTLDWRIPASGNSGLFLRAPDRQGRTSMKGFEVQIKDDRQLEDLVDASGAVFMRIAARGKFSKPPGQWNHFRIICKGRHIRVELNGHVTVNANMDAVNPAGEAPPMSQVPDVGYIGLQNHHCSVEFRNIRIREFDSATD